MSFLDILLHFVWFTIYSVVTLMNFWPMFSFLWDHLKEQIFFLLQMVLKGCNCKKLDKDLLLFIMKNCNSLFMKLRIPWFIPLFLCSSVSYFYSFFYFTFVTLFLFYHVYFSCAWFFFVRTLERNLEISRIC